MEDMGNETVRIPLGGDVSLLVPHKDVLDSYGLALRAKYGALAEQSKFAGESPDAYIEKLLSLYPKPEQQQYIRALAAIAKPGAYGLWALQCYAEGDPLDEKVKAVYPEALNTDIMGMGLEGDTSKWVVKMDRDEANEVITACNSAGYMLEKFTKQKVAERRQAIKALALGKETLEGASLSSQIKVAAEQLKLSVAGALVGPEITEQIIDAALEAQVTERSMEILSGSSAEHMREIAGYAADQFPPTKTYADFVGTVFALNELDIYPDVGLDIWKAFDATIAKPPRPPKS